MKAQKYNENSYKLAAVICRHFLTRPTIGEVLLWEKPLRGNEKKALPRIGGLIEAPGFYPNLTSTENLQIFAALRGVPGRYAIKDALDLMGLPYQDKKQFSHSGILSLVSCLLPGEGAFP